MQTSLTEESWEEDTRKEKIQDMLERDVQTLWTMESMTVDKALEELNNRSREFSDFAETFVGDVPKVRPVPSFFQRFSHFTDPSILRRMLSFKIHELNQMIKLD